MIATESGTFFQSNRPGINLNQWIRHSVATWLSDLVLDEHVTEEIFGPFGFQVQLVGAVQPSLIDPIRQRPALAGRSRSGRWRINAEGGVLIASLRLDRPTYLVSSAIVEVLEAMFRENGLVAYTNRRTEGALRIEVFARPQWWMITEPAGPGAERGWIDEVAAALNRAQSPKIAIVKMPAADGEQTDPRANEALESAVNQFSQTVARANGLASGGATVVTIESIRSRKEIVEALGDNVRLAQILEQIARRTSGPTGC